MCIPSLPKENLNRKRLKNMFNKHDIARDACQLFGARASRGYDWWWHSFTGYDAETGDAKPFFIEFFLCNPALGGDEPVFGQLPGKPQKPSYLMVKAGAWGEDAAQLHRFFGWKIIKVDWGDPSAWRPMTVSSPKTAPMAM